MANDSWHAFQHAFPELGDSMDSRSIKGYEGLYGYVIYDGIFICMLNK